MCWSETPHGIFDSTQAKAIGEALLKRIRDTDACEFAAAESAEQAEALKQQGWEQLPGAAGQIPVGFAESGSVFILRRSRAADPEESA